MSDEFLIFKQQSYIYILNSLIVVVVSTCRVHRSIRRRQCLKKPQSSETIQLIVKERDVIQGDGGGGKEQLYGTWRACALRSQSYSD